MCVRVFSICNNKSIFFSLFFFFSLSFFDFFFLILSIGCEPLLGGIHTTGRRIGSGYTNNHGIPAPVSNALTKRNKKKEKKRKVIR